ncbi:hypothetical protein [Bradyrhizobium arachidis]|uniref:hypothetical protein n=1 Tax=Bradyrhizobium arachidis TaxID=858423 RepID=UPI00188C62E0|nr:hypothetical protein [Bradyrhizobium arachidis]
MDIKKSGVSNALATASPSMRAVRTTAATLTGDFVHVCIDDLSRFAFSEIKPDEAPDSAVSFLKAALLQKPRSAVWMKRSALPFVLGV